MIPRLLVCRALRSAQIEIKGRASPVVSLDEQEDLGDSDFACVGSE